MLGLLPLTIVGIVAVLIVWTAFVWYTTWLVVRAARYWRNR